MNLFNPHSIAVLSIVLLGCAAFFELLALTSWIPAIRAFKACRKALKGDDTSIASLPGVSLIVLSDDDDVDRIERFLQQLESQTHPDFEIIVVCKAQAERAAALKEYFSSRYPDIHITFVPPQAVNLSHRKLAITLGMKAAHKEVAVITVSNAEVLSDAWLMEMTRPFAEESIDMVAGYAPGDFRELHGPSKWYRQFDTVMADARWMGNALKGKPYRADGNNMAIRVKTFFANNGFAKQMHLENGDDDIFVAQLASNGSGMAVCLSEGSRLRTHYGRVATTLWKNRKDQYNFTARYLRPTPFLSAALLSWCQWLTLGCCVAAALISLPNLIAAIIAVALLLLFWGWQIAIYRKVAGKLGAVRLWWALPVFMLWHPIGNAIFRLRRRGMNFRHFTWKRK